MADAIIVLNAGSSSLKFSVFVARETGLELDVRGNLEEIQTAPHFVAKGRDGRVRAEKSWGAGARLGHEGALDHLLAFLPGELAGDRLVGVGHRVVHGGAAYAQPVRVDRRLLAALEALVPLAPLHQPHNVAPIRVLLERTPDLPQVACYASHQWTIRKASTGRKTATTILPLVNDEERIEELALMLRGDSRSETTRKEAAEMLRAARKRAR